MTNVIVQGGEARVHVAVLTRVGVGAPYGSHDDVDQWHRGPVGGRFGDLVRGVIADDRCAEDQRVLGAVGEGPGSIGAGDGEQAAVQVISIEGCIRFVEGICQ